jgi:hypothetical protein
LASNCIVFISHFWNVEIQRRFDRLVREAPSEYDVFFLLNMGPEESGTFGIQQDRLIRRSPADLRQLPYPGKCRAEDWSMHGKADLLFLEVWREKPDYNYYWFVEYDVHYEGHWQTFFDYFRGSKADVLATIVSRVTDVPNIVDEMTPRLTFPPSIPWRQEHLIKAFFPICRISQATFHALDEDYRRGLVGHYELTVATVALLHGLEIEDIGGRGPYVRAENRDRFYFAAQSTYTHSPGTFVFRPAISKILPRPNTLWHPVKPDDAPVWFPLRLQGKPAKNFLEWLKLMLWPQVIWLWFAVRWNPLPQQTARDRPEPPDRPVAVRGARQAEAEPVTSRDRRLVQTD